MSEQIKTQRREEALRASSLLWVTRAATSIAINTVLILDIPQHVLYDRLKHM